MIKSAIFRKATGNKTSQNSNSCDCSLFSLQRVKSVNILFELNFLLILGTAQAQTTALLKKKVLLRQEKHRKPGM